MTFCGLCGNASAADLGQITGICLDPAACHRRQMVRRARRIEHLELELAAHSKLWRAVLAEHYLAEINCDPGKQLDNAVCGCSREFLGWWPSMGAARQSWIDHVDRVIALKLDEAWAAVVEVF